MQTNNQNIKPELELEVYKILKTASFLFPETPSEVEKFEKEFKEDSVKLPESISEASKVFDRICNSSNSKPLNLKPNYPVDDSVRNNLARAARDGGGISEELAEQMQKDRKKARDEMDGKK